MKTGAENSKGMPQELIALAAHEARRLSELFWGDTYFISDDLLAEELGEFVYSVPKTINRAMRDYANIALGNCMQVSNSKFVV